MQLVSRWVMIWLVAMVVTVRYVFGRIGTLFIRGKERRRQAVAHMKGRHLRWAMTKLGAAFIKLGQVLSTRPDLLDAEVIEELRLLQDKLPAFGFDKVRATVEAELGGKLEDHFDEFDEAPVAAASVAQVHRARLKGGGDEVAVKVLRPDVRSKAQRDGRIMLFLSKLMMFLPGSKSTDPAGHAEEFVEGIIQQTDLTREVDNYERFGENFETFDGIIFPHVYRELSTRKVLTMQFMHGTKADELGAGDHTDVVTIMRTGFLKMLFEDGFLHADLHPGNFVITPDRKVAIFDVGLAKNIHDELLVQYIDFSRCVAFGGTEDFVRHFKAFHEYLEDADWDAITEDVQAFVKKYRGKTTAELETGEMFADLFALGRRHGLRPKTEMTLMMVGMMTAEGVGKQLDADTDSMAAMAEYLMPILQKRGMLSPEWMPRGT